MSGGNAEIWLMSHQSSNKEAKEPTTTNKSKKSGMRDSIVRAPEPIHLDKNQAESLPLPPSSS